MTKANRTRRQNTRAAIACHKGGRPEDAPRWGWRWERWNAGQRRAAKVGKKSHHDLDRGHERLPASSERQYRCAARTFCPPKLPAQQKPYERKRGLH